MSTDERRVLIIAGPTASGKSEVAVYVAELLGGEIISADSRQVYRYATIGTAKPPREVLSRVPHYFIDEYEPDRTFSAGEFGERGREIIEGLFQRGVVPVVVGGSGLYLKSLVDGFFEDVPAEPSVRQNLNDRLRKEGLPALVRELDKIDPETAARVDRNNPRRVLRALEVFYVAGEPLSSIQQKKKVNVKFSSSWFGLAWDRAKLYARINERVDWMIRAGLVEEVKKLRSMGYDESNASAQLWESVGYAEVLSYLRGDIEFTEMVDLIKRNTRRYAKRQMTWFRKEKRIRWLHLLNESELKEAAAKIAEEFGSDRTKRTTQ
ncbi:MAG: tRNA (adenosine(37)-N6)-dimethylallyltransferase MiaA [Bacteroidota bacterium]